MLLQVLLGGAIMVATTIVHAGGIGRRASVARAGARAGARETSRAGLLLGALAGRSRPWSSSCSWPSSSRRAWFILGVVPLVVAARAGFKQLRRVGRRTVGLPADPDLPAPDNGP